MKVKSLDFEDTILLAPMADYSDVGFRSVCYECGADATFTEMISAQALLHENKKTADMLVTDEREGIVIAQIFGKDPVSMSEAVKNPLLKKFDGIDINMGCPAHKIIKNGEGSALLNNLSLAGKIINDCAKVVEGRTLSVKVRLGFDRENIVDIVKMCQENGADFVTIHGRTAAQGYSGEPDYEAIAKAISYAKIPVIANGNITDKFSHDRMIEMGASGVMIGRGAIGKPWIFAQLKGKSFDQFACLEDHIKILRKYYPEKWLNLYLRKHFLAYAATLKCGNDVKKRLALQNNIDESLNLIKQACKHFEN